MSEKPIDTNLSNKMRALALKRTDLKMEFLRAAERFDEAYRGFYLSNPQTVTVMQFIGAYAKAKRLWSEATGEPLI